MLPKYTKESWESFLQNFLLTLRSEILCQNPEGLDAIGNEICRWDRFYLTENKARQFPYFLKQRQLIAEPDPFREKKDTLLGMAYQAFSTRSSSSEDFPLYKSQSGWRNRVFQFLTNSADQDKSIAEASIPFLMVDKESDSYTGRALKKGRVGYLTLKLVKGEGKMYPCPLKNPFLVIDRTFLETLKFCVQWVGSQKEPIWPDRTDLLWDLEGFSGYKIFSAGGNSIFLAFCLCLYKLLTGEQSLDLEGIAASATSELLKKKKFPPKILSSLESEFDGKALFESSSNLERNLQNLSEVGGIQQKILHEFQDLAEKRLIQRVIIAQDQPDIPSTIEKQGRDFTLHRAKTIEEAINTLRENQRAREILKKHTLEVLCQMDLLGKKGNLFDHYQPLPLLQEVEEHSSSSSIENPFLRWEERTLQGSHKTYRSCSLRDILTKTSLFFTKKPDLPFSLAQFVLLGPPGTGKSTFLLYLARELFENPCITGRKSFLPVVISLRNWMGWACAESRQNYSLSDYLAEASGYPASIHREEWRDWLERGRAFLLIDGLDEISGHRWEKTFMEKCLLPLLHSRVSPFVLTCRTLSFQRLRSQTDHLSLFILGGFTRADQKNFIETFPSRNPDQKKSALLIEKIRGSSSLGLLTSSPLLLNIICFITEEMSVESMPATRTEFYEKCLFKLLDSQPAKHTVQWPGSEPRIKIKRKLLERIAGEAFLKGEEQVLFPEEELTNLIKRTLLEGNDYNTDLEGWAKAFIEDFTENSGILREQKKLTGSSYFFLHLTLQEFLCSSYIASLVEPRETPRFSASQKARLSLEQLISTKGWNPRWYEVFSFLAGQLKNPLPLIGKLCRSSRDDWFRHRLGLSALCLSEIRQEQLSPQQKEAFEELKTEIGSEIFSLWWHHRQKNTHRTYSHLFFTLPILIQTNCKIIEDEKNAPLYLLEVLDKKLLQQTPQGALRIVETLDKLSQYCPGQILPLLIRALKHRDSLVRWRAARALGILGEEASEALPYLMEALRDLDSSVRSYSAEALGNMKGTASEALPGIVEALSDPDSSVQASAAYALGKIQGAITTKTADLMGLLGGKKAELRMAALLAVARLGEESAPFLPEVIKALKDPAPLLRRGAIQTLGNMGREALSSLPLLIEALRDPHPLVSDQAARTLGKLGREEPERLVPFLMDLFPRPSDSVLPKRSSLPVPLGKKYPLLSEVFQTLRREGSLLRSGILRALGIIGRKGSPLIEELTQKLAHPSALHRWLAAEILGAFEKEALPALGNLTKALSDQNGFVRVSALQALGGLGKGALPALPQLVESLGDRDFFVKWTGAKALGKIGKEAPEEVLPYLKELLQKKDQSLKWKAISALGTLEREALPLLPDLVQAFREGDSFVRSASVEALGNMGKESFAALPELMEALDDEDSSVRLQAAQALLRLMDYYRIFREKDHWIGRSLEDLQKERSISKRKR